MFPALTVFLTVHAVSFYMAYGQSSSPHPWEGVTGVTGVTTSYPIATGNDTVSFDSSTEAAVVAATSGFDYWGLVIVPIILLTGVLGNSLSVAIMRSKSFSGMSISLVLTMLALSDITLSIMVPFNKQFFMRAVGMDLRAISWASCKIFFWCWRTAKMTSSWLVALISVERFNAVYFPLKVVQLNSPRNIRLAVAAIYLGIGTFNMAWGISCDVLQNGSCLPNMAHIVTPQTAKSLVIGGTLIYSIVPAIIIVLLNFLIIGRLIRQRATRKKLTGDVDQAVGDKTGKMTRTLVLVATAFIVLVVPISIVHCITLLAGIPIFQTTDPTITLVREITQTMEQLNYSINFFLYVLASKSFRDEFLSLTGLSRWFGPGPRDKQRSGRSTKSTLTRKGSSRRKQHQATEDPQQVIVPEA